MATKYTVPFSGTNIEATVTNKAATVDQWINEIKSLNRLRTTTIVGLDCEWKPNTISTMNNKTATLQLCTSTKCLIVQLFYLDYIPQSLRDFLGSRNFTFVGVEVDDDVSKLRDEYGLRVANAVDIQARAMSRWPVKYYRKPGLKTLGYDVAGLSMEKPILVCRSNWEVQVLSREQIRYACIDAYVCFKIGEALLSN